jgi:hypothetical protein
VNISILTTGCPPLQVRRIVDVYLRGQGTPEILSLNTGFLQFIMSGKLSGDEKDGFVSVRRSDLERIMALLSRLEDQDHIRQAQEPT